MSTAEPADMSPGAAGIPLTRRIHPNMDQGGQASNVTQRREEPVRGGRHVLGAGMALPINFSWTFLGNAVYAICQWGILVALAKLGTPEMVGDFALAVAVTTPVVMLANLQLRSLQATDARYDYSFANYLGLRLVAAPTALLVIVGIAFATASRSDARLVIVLVGVQKAIESVTDVIYGRFQQDEQMERIAKSMMLRGSLSLAALGAGVAWTKGLPWGALGIVCAEALVFAGYDILSAKGFLQVADAQSGSEPKGAGWQILRPCWETHRLASLTRYALPLGLTMMLGSLSWNIPRYVIERYLGRRDLGFFSASAYFILVGHLVINALGQSAAPRLAKHYASANHGAFRRLLLGLAGFGLALGAAGVVVAAVAGAQILTLAYQPEYARQVQVLVWVMAAAAIDYVASVLGVGMTAARYLRVQVPLFALVTAVTAVASLWLIPSHGLLGAAMALGIAGIVQTVGSMGILTHAMRMLGRRAQAKQQVTLYGK